MTAKRKKQKTKNKKQKTKKTKTKKQKQKEKLKEKKMITKQAQNLCSELSIGFGHPDVTFLL